MPSRIVREGINSSPRVNALSMGAEVFYRRLMSVVDDYGRYHGSVVTLRGACWPTKPERIREKDVTGWLNELLSGDNPLVRTYSIHGASYLEIQDFGQQTRTKSRFPNPPWEQSDINPPAKVNQVDSNRLENDGTSRSRISKSKSKSAGDSDFENELEQTVIKIHDRHPAFRRTGQKSIKKKLRTICLKIPVAERIEKLRQIDSNHAAWCAYWERDPGSKFAKALENWLAPTEGRFDEEPPVAATAAGSGDPRLWM